MVYVLIGCTTDMMSCMQGRAHLQRYMAALEQQLHQEVAQREDLQQQLLHQRGQSDQLALMIAVVRLQQQHHRQQLPVAWGRRQTE